MNKWKENGKNGNCELMVQYNSIGIEKWIYKGWEFK